MADNPQSEAGARCIALEGEMTISRAATLKVELLAALDQCRGLEINLAGVYEIDTAGLQLLLLLKQEANLRGIPLRLVAHSPPVVELLDLTNLAGHFGDPLVITSTSNRTEDA